MSENYPSTDILLPYKERMTRENAGAVARIVNALACHSKQKERLKIFGRPLDGTLLDPIDYHGLKARFPLIYGHNKGFAMAYIKDLKSRADKPDLIEIHARCSSARIIKKACPDICVSLYLHNDPREMKGGKSVEERMWLLAHLDAIIFVSDYLRACFLDALPDITQYKDKLFVIRNEVTRFHDTLPQKKRHIIIAGRMVPEKGILPACEAVARILPQFKDWAVDVAGGKQFKDSALSDYEKHVRAVLTPLGAQAKHHGFISGDSLARLQAQAEIAIVPSLWQEPAGLTVLEALCHGCALITTDKGGIPETASGRADIISLKGKNLAETLHSQNLVDLFAKHLESLLRQPEKRRDFQKRAWEDYPFSAANMAENADNYRISMAC